MNKIKFHLSGDMFCELGFDNDGIVEELKPSLQTVLFGVLYKSQKRGRGYTYIFEVEPAIARDFVDEMRFASEGKTYGVDPDCARLNKRILKRADKIEKMIGESK